MELLTKISNLFTGRKAYDPTFEASGYSVARFFLNRRSLNVNEPTALLDAYASHELAYACINKIADVMNDAEVIVEKRTGSNGQAKWQKVEGHPLQSLFRRPNPHETGKDFRRLMVQSEYAAGIFFGEIVRSSAGMPVELYALNPNKVEPRVNKGNTAIQFYEYKHSDGTVHKIKPENMLVRQRPDLVNRFFGLSPMAVALKSINSDIALTDYVDAFFESDGTPSGILKILNATVPDVKKEALQAQWYRKYSRYGTNHKGLAVLDQNADYQKIGAQLNELDTSNVSARFESRICSVFGVPPILVGSLVGLTHTTANATAKSALNDFWDNKISPDLAQFREWLTWVMLPEFEDIEAIKADRIRVSYDISQAAFLQEDQDQLHSRARENFKAGLMMLNEAREAIGLAPDDSAKGQDYYIQPSTFVAITGERRLEEAESEPEPMPAPLQLGDGEPEPVEALDARKCVVCSEGFKNEHIYEGSKDGYSGDFHRGCWYGGTKKAEKGLLFRIKAIKDEPIPEPVVPLPEVKKLSVEYDGMMLRREPDHIEKLCDLKSMVNELEINQERAQKVLHRFRLTLIEQATEKLDRRDPGNAHMITLEADTKTRKELGKAVRNAYATGQNQVARELMNQSRARKVDASIRAIKAMDEDDLEYIEELTDGLVSRMINEMRTRAINQFLAMKILTNYAKEALAQVLGEQSDKFVKQLAESVINAATQSGRTDEAAARKDEWDNVQYSAILDGNTCGPCEEADGMEADKAEDLPPTPNPECLGGTSCRCFHIWIKV
jgi:HK97 family phage portal protein